MWCWLVTLTDFHINSSMAKRHKKYKTGKLNQTLYFISNFFFFKSYRIFIVYVNWIWLDSSSSSFTHTVLFANYLTSFSLTFSLDTSFNMNWLTWGDGVLFVGCVVCFNNKNKQTHFVLVHLPLKLHTNQCYVLSPNQPFIYLSSFDDTVVVLTVIWSMYIGSQQLIFKFNIAEFC